MTDGQHATRRRDPPGPGPLPVRDRFRNPRRTTARTVPRRRGRDRDTEGRPAAGAIVRVERLAEIRDADTDPLLAGKPTSGVKAMGLTIDPFPSATITGTRFEVLGMRPGRERFVEFRQETLGLAGALTVKSPRPAAEPLTVKLVRCGTLAGRLLADDGVPLRGRS